MGPGCEWSAFQALGTNLTEKYKINDELQAKGNTKVEDQNRTHQKNKTKKKLNKIKIIENKKSPASISDTTVDFFLPLTEGTLKMM